MTPKVFFSNSLDLLAKIFSKNIYGGKPFDTRIVIVPNNLIKNWLQLRTAKEAGISFGIEILLLENAIEKIKQIFNLPIKKNIPFIETTFLIENEINLNLKSKLPWQNLHNYIQENEKRKIEVSDYLSHLFKQYGIYSDENVKQWSNDKNDWQKELWTKITNDNSYPAKELSKKLIIKKNDNVSIHLFGFNYLPPIYYNFFNQLAKATSIKHYIFSPCKEFWTDLLSDKEQSTLLKKIKIDKEKDSLEDLLQDKNLLLANLGRLGRRYQRMFENNEFQVEEHYIINKKTTILENLQHDLLQAESPNTKINFEKNDFSIQIHNASSLLQEIEVLYNNVLKILTNQKINPSDIIVMSPNLVKYEPFIKAIFNNEKYKIPFLLADGTTKAPNSIINGFFKLLKLQNSRWEATELLALFSNETFKRKFKLQNNDIAQIKSWIKEAKIKWGYEAKHRNEILSHCKNEMTTENATWENGFKKLLQSLATESTISIDFTQTTLLGKLIQIIHLLKNEVETLAKSKLTLIEWSELLKNILDNYFSIDKKNNNESYEYSLLNKQLMHLKSAGGNIKNGKFPFQSILPRLEKLLQNSPSNIQGDNLEAIQFCNLSNMKVTDVKVICLIGLDNDFPKQDANNALNLLKSKQIPSKTEQDRYLFLEAITLAKQNLIISFQKNDEVNNPSILITELTNYLDKHYSIKNAPVSTFINNKKGNFTNQKTKKRTSFFNNPLNTPKTFEATTVDINDLNKLCKNPIQFYCNKTLEIYLQEEKREEILCEENFLLNKLDLFLAKQNSINYSIDEIKDKLEKAGKLPSGIFGQMASQKLDKELNLIYKNMKKIGIEKAFSITLTKCKKIRELSPQNWEVPAIPVKCDFGELLIVGQINNICEKGIVLNDKYSNESFFKNLPMKLIIEHLPVEKNLIFLGNSKIISKQPTVTLSNFLNYYFTSIINCSPLMPNWITKCLEKNWESLDKEINNLSNEYMYRDKYVKWLFDKKPEDANKIFEPWHSFAKQLFTNHK